MTAHSDGPGVVVVGLDGLEPSLVRAWSDEMPTLSGLWKRGSFGRVRSADPPLSVPAWPWIYTGKQGGKHGCFSFTKRDSDAYDWDPVNYGDVDAESLWEALDDAGVSCGVANVPLTYPPSELEHGYVVAGWPAPNRAAVSEPPEILDLIESDIGERYRVNPFSVGPELMQADDEEVLADITEGLWHHERAFETLIRETDVEVFSCVFMATDVAGHYLGRNRTKLRDLYAEADRALGELLSTCSDDTDVIVLSDHGHAAPSDWNFHMNEWLRQEGYLSMTDATGVGPRTLLRRVGMTRERLIAVKRAAGLDDVRSRLPQSVLDVIERVVPPADEHSEGFDADRVDWSETEAYCPDQNVVFLNDTETHPSGIVDPARAKELRSELVEKLQEVTHPEPGRDDQLMTNLRRKEDVFEGPFTDEAPDVVPVADDMQVGIQTSFNDGETIARTEWSEHRPYGTLVTAGDSFACAGEVSDGSVLDLFPLVLTLADAPVPENVDGTLPSDRLSDNMDVTYRESHDEHATRREYSDAEREEVREQLKGLGYLE